MRLLTISFLALLCASVRAQELFTFTEPASNMPAGSIGVRLNNTLMLIDGSEASFRLNPEIMFGFSRSLMAHADLYLGDRLGRFATEGGSAYLKYRFLSKDDVHRHFRASVYGRIAGFRTPIDQEAVELTGRNSGYEIGLVATQLLYKLAISGSASWLHTFEKSSFNYLPVVVPLKDAFGYSVSLGKLVLPKEYTDYRQTNLNIMLEALGQVNPIIRKDFLDLAPSLQFIFLSKMRLDLGYRFGIRNSLSRISTRSCFLRFEYNLYNVL